MNPRMRIPSLPLLCGLVAAAVAAPATSAAQDRGDTSCAIARNAVVDITVRSGNVVVRGSDRSDGELRSSSGGYTLRSTGVGIVVATRSVTRPAVRSALRSSRDD